MAKPRLTDVSGVGEVTAAHLAESGIDSVAALAKANPAVIVSIPGFGSSRAAAVQRAAATLLQQAKKAKKAKRKAKKKAKKKAKRKAKRKRAKDRAALDKAAPSKGAPKSSGAKTSGKKKTSGKGAKRSRA